MVKTYAEVVLQHATVGLGFLLGLFCILIYVLFTAFSSKKLINPYYSLQVFASGGAIIFSVRVICLALINSCELSDNEAYTLLVGGVAFIIIAIVSIKTAIENSEKKKS